MEIFAISGLLNAIVALGFGILVFSKNWNDRSNILFFCMTLVLAVWGISYWKWMSVSDYDSAFFWVRLLAASSLFIPVFFSHWVFSILKKRGVATILVTTSYVIAIAASSLIGTEYLVVSLEPKLLFAFWPNAGVAYSTYIAIGYVGLVSYTIFVLINSLKHVGKEKRGQIFYILAGAILGFGGGATNFPLWYDIPILPYGTFLVVTFPLLFGYSIVKHKLFNIKSVATEVLVFFFVILLLVQAIMAQTALESILRWIFFAAAAAFGFLIVKSVYREVEQREKIETLAKDLEKTNVDLESANVRLKELDNLKSEFVSLASHQMRGPITAIKGYTSLILDNSYGPVPDKIKEPVGIIFESSKNMATIVDDFLNLTKIEQGKMNYDFTLIDICELSKGVVKELSPNIEKKGLKFIFSCDEGKNFKAIADKGKISQVIMNIVDNSVKYTPSGSVSLSIQRIDASDHPMIRIHVSDTGVGIAADAIPKLFQKFSRARNANEANVLGTGLGLYVVKQMVEAHSGKVWVESAGEGKGSHFIVEIPAA